MHILKWPAIALVTLVVAAAIFLALFDWNLLRGMIGEKVTAQTGREFSIAGDLDVDLGLPSRIHAEQVRFENAEWGHAPYMLDLEAVDFSIRLLPLLSKKIVIPEIAFTRPVISLEKNAEGKGNWELGDEDEEGEFPRIGRLTVDAGKITYLDPAIATDITAEVATDTAKTNGATQFSAKGQFKSMPASASGTSGSVFLLRDKTQPFPLAGKVRIGATHANIDGTITGLATFDSASLDLDLNGKSLADLFPILGLTLPETPPYRLRGYLAHEGKLSRFDNLDGKVGDSDLRGDFAIDAAGEKPHITAQLESKLLDFDDLAGFIGAAPDPKETASREQKQKAAAAKAEPGVLPKKEFDLTKLNAMNADVKYRAENVKSRDALPLDHLVAHLVLENGALTLKPLTFGVAGGNIVSDFAMKAQAISATVSFERLKLDRLLPDLPSSKASVGIIGGRGKLSAAGNSIAEWADSVDGNVALVMSGGRISNLLLEIIGLDGGEVMKFLFGGDQAVPLRCAVGEFKVADGVVTAETFVVDTADTNVLGEGKAHLGKEQLDVELKPVPKDASVFSARSPIHIEGSFEDPKVRPDKKLFARAGAALALGALVNPLVALIPLIETGPGKNHDCAQLIAKAQPPDAKRGGPAGVKGKSDTPRILDR
ncbi:MAG: AsmA family protein [Burkholderiales bacterium]